MGRLMGGCPEIKWNALKIGPATLKCTIIWPITGISPIKKPYSLI